jgi:DnaJ-class molecular chaperone
MIPIGSENNDTITLKQVGNINIGNNNRDDVKITIKITEDELFKTSHAGLVLNATDIVTILNVPLVNALCGIARKIILPNGELCMFVTNTVTKSNDIFVMDNAGLPQRNNKSVRGRLFIIINVDYPDSLSSKTSAQIFELLKCFDTNDIVNKTSYNELKIMKYQ